MIREISDAMCVIDHENRVVWVNGTFHDWFSHHGSVLGKKLDMLLPGVPDVCTKGAVFSDVDPGHRRRYFEVDCVPTYDENHMKVSDLIAFRDVTILQTLLNISDLTVATTTARELLDKALDLIGETLGYKTIAALLYEAGDLELAASRGYSPMLKSLLAHQKVSPKEKGLAGRSAFKNQIIIKEIKQGTVSEKLLRESRRLGISSVTTVPLSDRGVLVGVLAVSTSSTPTADQVNLLKIVCNQLSVSLRKILFEEELVNAKDEMEMYIDLMCHDIANADQAALGYLELLKNKREYNDQYVESAISSVFRVNALIDNVRKVRRAHTKPMGVVSVSDALETAIGDVRSAPGWNGRKIDIYMSVPDDVYVKANALLRDLFYNILEAETRRMHNGGSINISATSANNSYDIVFEDSGPGIENMNMSLTFKQFVKSPRTGQAGLGLYLLLSLVYTFGGHIYVEDRIAGEPEKGSRTVLTLRKG